MNQNQNLSNESNTIPTINQNIPLIDSNENKTSSLNKNSLKENTIEGKKIIENENDIITLSQIENDKYCKTNKINDSSFNPQNKKISDLNASDISYNNNYPNPFT